MTKIGVLFDYLKAEGGGVTIESFDPNMANIARLCYIRRKLAESPEELHFKPNSEAWDHARPGRR